MPRAHSALFVDPLTNCVSVRPQAPGQTFTYNCDALPLRRVGCSKVTPLHKGDAEHLEVAWSDEIRFAGPLGFIRCGDVRRTPKIRIHVDRARCWNALGNRR